MRLAARDEGGARLRRQMARALYAVSLMRLKTRSAAGSCQGEVLLGSHG